jgi:hypothetical protein
MMDEWMDGSSTGRTRDLVTDTQSREFTSVGPRVTFSTGIWVYEGHRGGRVKMGVRHVLSNSLVLGYGMFAYMY